jgi:truncated hemoglobin YjbI
MSIEVNLYDRVGGSVAIKSVTEAFYKKVLADEDLAPYFAFVNMERLIGMQTSFLTMAFGGPAEYKGRSLRDAHASLRDLDDQHFDKVVGHLAATLREFGVGDADISAAGAVAESVRNDVLNR